MKTKVNIIICSFILTALMSCSTGRYASAQSDDAYYSSGYNGEYGTEQYDESNVNMNVFVDALSPYGRWMYYPQYGQVWIANESNFIPYSTNGNWVYTNYGWTWASNYSWGWGPFHYGRWAYDPFYGWMWVPGYKWAPAWVGWRTGGDYFGWAPLAPGININIGYGNYIPASSWIFLPKRYMATPNWYNYRVNNSRNTTIINNTTVINNTNIYKNTKYVVGPKPIDVERATGQRIVPKKIVSESTPSKGAVVNNKTVSLYRPDLTRPSGAIKKVGEGQAVESGRVPERKIKPVPQRNIQPDTRSKINQQPERTNPPQRQVNPEPRQVNPEPRRISPQPQSVPQPRTAQPGRVIPQANSQRENERNRMQLSSQLNERRQQQDANNRRELQQMQRSQLAERSPVSRPPQRQIQSAPVQQRVMTNPSARPLSSEVINKRRDN